MKKAFCLLLSLVLLASLCACGGEVLAEEGATLETGSEFTGKVTRIANGTLTIK